jgi:NhaP-type Na+/H+ or K+/H+ antiporter
MAAKNCGRLGALTQWFMSRVQSKEGQFLVMLLVVTTAAIGAEAIHLEGIIGAFLAGLALNRAVHESPAKHELEFALTATGRRDAGSRPGGIRSPRREGVEG